MSLSVSLPKVPTRFSSVASRMTLMLRPRLKKLPPVMASPIDESDTFRAEAFASVGAKMPQRAIQNPGREKIPRAGFLDGVLRDLGYLSTARRRARPACSIIHRVISRHS